MNIHSSARTSPAGRALLVRRIQQDCWSVVEAAEAAGISTRTAHKWLKRFDRRAQRGCSTAARVRTGVRRSCQDRGRTSSSSYGSRR